MFSTQMIRERTFGRSEQPRHNEHLGTSAQIAAIAHVSQHASCLRIDMAHPLKHDHIAKLSGNQEYESETAFNKILDADFFLDRNKDATAVSVENYVHDPNGSSELNHEIPGGFKTVVTLQAKNPRLLSRDARRVAATLSHSFGKVALTALDGRNAESRVFINLRGHDLGSHGIEA